MNPLAIVSLVSLGLCVVSFIVLVASERGEALLALTAMALAVTAIITGVLNSVSNENEKVRNAMERCLSEGGTWLASGDPVTFERGTTIWVYRSASQERDYTCVVPRGVHGDD